MQIRCAVAAACLLAAGVAAGTEGLRLTSPDGAVQAELAAEAELAAVPLLAMMVAGEASAEMPEMVERVMVETATVVAPLVAAFTVKAVQPYILPE